MHSQIFDWPVGALGRFAPSRPACAVTVTKDASHESRDALRQLARNKEEMAELVAHDLRNYFTNIMLATDLLSSSGLATARQRRLVDSIRNSADSGSLFLQAFLDQQEDKAHGARIEPLPLRQLLCEVADLFSPQAAAKNIRLELAMHETVIVSGLRAGVLQVLQNLVSNAIKYSPRDSAICMTAARRGKYGRVEVMDRGPGIAEAERPMLFQRFVRLSSTPTAGEAASGLGLALAKQQARAMGGNLGYEDRSGGGSIFALELPLVP